MYSVVVLFVYSTVLFVYSTVLGGRKCSFSGSASASWRIVVFVSTIKTSCEGSLPSLVLLTSTGQSEMLRAWEALLLREVCLLLFRVQMLKINNLWWKLLNPHFDVSSILPLEQLGLSVLRTNIDSEFRLFLYIFLDRFRLRTLIPDFLW